MPWFSALRKAAEVGPSAEPAREGSTGGRAESELRSDAETILRAAIDASDAERLVAECLERRLDGSDAPAGVRVAGFGVAAASMARGARSMLGRRISDGVLIVPAEAPSEGLDTFVGGHPLPDPGSAAGAGAIRQLARESTADDLMIGLVSGGGSSLLTLAPDRLPLDDVRDVSRMLLVSGASAEEIACVRSHLDALKGGRLAAEAAPAAVLALVLCDGPDDTIDTVASGPFSPSPSTFRDAVEVLRQYDLWKGVPLAVRGYLDRGLCGEIADSPGANAPCFARVETVSVGSGRTAATAACERAAQLGYDAQLLTTELTGTAREAGVFLATAARSLEARRGTGHGPSCIVSAGNPRVRHFGNGPVGPAQELALGAALDLAPLAEVLLASMSTAGADGDTGAAGAVVTSATPTRATEAGIDCERALERGEAHEVFDALDDAIVTGPTGTHVGNIQILLLP